MNKIGIALSPLTDKVFLGKQDAAKSMFTGTKEDITNQFVGVMFQYLPPMVIRTIASSDKSQNMFVNIPRNKESVDRAIKHLKEISDML